MYLQIWDYEKRFFLIALACILAIHTTLEIKDVETEEVLVTSGASDRFNVDLSSTLRAGYVQTALTTTPGHDYLIYVSSDTVISGKSFDDFYNISV